MKETPEELRLRAIQFLSQLQLKVTEDRIEMVMRSIAYDRRK